MTEKMHPTTNHTLATWVAPRLRSIGGADDAEGGPNPFTYENFEVSLPVSPS